MDNPIRYESEDEIDQFSSFINDIGVSDKQRSLIRDIHDSITKDPENDKACFEKIDILMKDFQQGTHKPSNKKAIMSKLENLKTTVEKSSTHEKKIIKITQKVNMYDKIRQHVSDHMSSLRRKQNKR